MCKVFFNSHSKISLIRIGAIIDYASTLYFMLICHQKKQVHMYSSHSASKGHPNNNNLALKVIHF